MLKTCSRQMVGVIALENVTPDVGVWTGEWPSVGDTDPVPGGENP